MASRPKQWLSIAIAVFVLTLLFARWRSEKHEAPPLAPRAEPPPPAPSPPPKPPAAPSKRPSAPLPQAPAGPDEHCAPHARRDCYQGDVWLLDGCDALEKKLAECGDQLCRGGTCEQPDATSCVDPSEGRCEGEVVRACVGGRAVRINCAAKGLTCGSGAEGAQCVERIPREQRCQGPDRCDGQRLLGCVAGRAVSQDCAAQGSLCMSLPGAARPRCVALKPAAELPCGPCGCSRATARTEVSCDGRDEDGSGFADDELACGAIPVVAFIVSAGSGQSSHGPDDVNVELARVNRYFANTRVEHPPRFVLDSLEWLADDALLDLDEDDLRRLADSPRIHPQREAFYVPVLFTDRVLVGGGTPKLGVSTLPNGSCGKMQQEYGPEQGLVAVAKARAPSTLAHELGHFFGLCHTQETLIGPPLVALADAYGGTPRTCRPACFGEGDGLCDTPLDPGPELCRHDETCEVACNSGDEPDTTNLMSYYTDCRSHFSDEQVRLMQESAGLRRAWFPCRGGQCECEVGSAECPPGMSCRPVKVAGERGLRCMLDGPLARGMACPRPGLCGKDMVCLTVGGDDGRCVRACAASSSDCACIAASEQLSVCSEDLR